MSLAAQAQRIDPRHVDVADVLVSGHPAATLTRTPEGGAVFAYLPDYLSGGGPAVATTLPLTDEPVRSGAGAIPPFFAGLLPEGRRLTNLRRSVMSADDLSLLLAVGEDLSGDVQVVPTGHAPAERPVSGGEGHWAELDFMRLFASSGIVDPAALAGVQDKASGGMLALPLAHGGRTHLLKLEPPGRPGMVRNEAFFLSAARRLRHRVADTEVVHDRAGRPGLLVRRFDRIAGDQGVRRLAVEDGAQLLRRYPADKYAVTVEDVVDAIAGVCAARSVAVRAVLQQVAFAWLTGNGDLHAKNIAVLSDRAGASDADVSVPEWRVAPIYDIPSTLPYGDGNMALTARGRTDSLSRKRYLALADRSDLPRRAAERALEEVLKVTAGIGDEASDALELAPGPARRLRSVLARRHSLLEG